VRHEQNEPATDDSFCDNYVVDEGRSLRVVLQEMGSKPPWAAAGKSRGSEQSGSVVKDTLEQLFAKTRVRAPSQAIPRNIKRLPTLR